MWESTSGIILYLPIEITDLKGNDSLKISPMWSLSVFTEAIFSSSKKTLYNTIEYDLKRRLFFSSTAGQQGAPQLQPVQTHPKKKNCRA